MTRYSYKTATGLFVTGGYFEPNIDAATEAVITLPRLVDVRSEKLDLLNRTIIPKTQAEIDAYDAALADASAQAEIDAQKTLKAVVLWLCQQLNVAPATARAQIIAIRKTL